ncbi:MAG: hypothetical protein HRT36_09065 [Alphaproteobacteria bacterium]|nr:hypothetical protein [Alphaproteobacteria bacterium]
MIYSLDFQTKNVVGSTSWTPSKTSFKSRFSDLIARIEFQGALWRILFL